MRGMLSAQPLTGQKAGQSWFGSRSAQETAHAVLRKTGPYCDTSNATFQIDYVLPKDGGRSDRVSNLALACPACNR